MKNKLLDANGVVIHYLAKNYLIPVHLKSPDDDGLYFYNQSPLIVAEEQPILKEVSFIIQLQQWNELSQAYSDADFYFSTDGKSLRYEAIQDIEEFILDIMKIVMEDELLFKWLEPFVKFELRERKIDELI